jgi:aldehyde dehydrogenase (NAD+)/betaine-aldehyde dehydrogenase
MAIDPSTGHEFAEIPATTAEQVGEMVQDAHRALAVEHEWRDPRVRGRALAALARAAAERAGALADLLCRDTGTPLARARAEVREAVAQLEAHGVRPGEAALAPGALTYTLAEPWGVCAQVISYRAPFGTAARLAGAALAAGNAVIVKPSERASVAPLQLAELAEAAGVPRGMLQVATGDGGVAAALAADPGVDHVTFAGSPRVASELAAICARRLAPFELELAVSPVHIVFADADLEQAVAAIARTLGARVFVEGSAHDDLVARLEPALAALKLGPAPENPDVGPAITGEFAHPTVVREGGGAAAGGEAAAGAGVAGGSAPAWPHISVAPLDREAEGLAALGRGPASVAAAAAVWTADVGRAQSVAARLPAARVAINAPPPEPQPGAPNPYVRTKQVRLSIPR